ncbi:MAG: efflux transporter outer membrane subunit [Burkholderiales bacterium]|nr:efflux transporter outer membrane subunit [Burkholderiales bacterium]
MNAGMRRPYAILFAALATLALGACATAGGPVARAPDMPGAWAEAGAPEAAAPARDWWRGFGSAELSGLIDAAMRANPDMAIAAEHVRQAEAQARIAGATLFPALNFGAATARRETRPHGGPWSGADSSSGALSASYEVDVWGKNALGVRAAEASLRASRFDRETVRLTLIAGIAGGYFQVLSLRARLAIVRENLAIAERVFKVVDARARNGAVSTLDVARQQAAVLAQRAAIPPLELQERQTLFALAILLGRQPEAFDVAAMNVSDVLVPPIGAGIPAALLVRRPDLAGAEAQLAAANANVASARAALLPGISLSGSAGLASDMLLNFLSAPAAAIAIGASLSQPILDGGRLRAQVDVAASRERELIENYRKVILAALADVESALAAGGRGADREVLQQQILEQARLALRLAEVRYREGADDLLTVLDAQRTLFQAQDQLAQLRLARLQASVGLFKALGGGWNKQLRFEE